MLSNSISPEKALKSAFEMQLRAVEMIEAAARTFENEVLVGERILPAKGDGQS